MLQILQMSHILSDFSTAVFSSAAISLLALTQGNIWLFENSVLISGRLFGNVSLFVTLKKHIIATEIIATINEDKTRIIYNLLFVFIDSSSWPVVQFPKSLLNLTDANDIAEIKAYLTVPQRLEDSFKNTPGIMDSTSGTFAS